MLKREKSISTPLLQGVTRVEQLQVGDVWYGKVGTEYDGIQATITCITPRRVQISFDQKVDGKLGITLSQKRFRKIFQKQRSYIQLDLFKDMDNKRAD